MEGEGVGTMFSETMPSETMLQSKGRREIPPIDTISHIKAVIPAERKYSLIASTTSVKQIHSSFSAS
jgi:hypothetical protein